LKNISIDWLKKELNQYLEKFQKLLESLASVELKKVDEASAFPDASVAAPESDYLFKIVVLGDPEVGKTSTVLRYTENAFKRSYIPTIGVNISSKNIMQQNKSIQLLLWDLAGQAKFSYTRQQFYQGSQGALLVFSLTDKKSFESISKWYDDLKQMKEFPKLKIVLCGNKSDLENLHQVKKEEAEGMAKKYGIPYFEVSALTGKNNKELFDTIINALMNNK
jgi:small GTP-binding protein